MNNRRKPKIMFNCRTNGRRRLGRPLKGLVGEAKTGLSRPNSSRMMMMMMNLENNANVQKTIDKRP